MSKAGRECVGTCGRGFGGDKVRGAFPGGGRAAEAGVGEGGPAGEEPPEGDEEQAHAGYDGFLFAHRAAVGRAPHRAPFGQAPPAGLPAEQPPDGFGKQAAQAAVALPVAAAEELAARAGAALAGRAADESSGARSPKSGAFARRAAPEGAGNPPTFLRLRKRGQSRTSRQAVSAVGCPRPWGSGMVRGCAASAASGMSRARIRAWTAGAMGRCGGRAAASQSSPAVVRWARSCGHFFWPHQHSGKSSGPWS